MGVFGLDRVTLVVNLEVSLGQELGGLPRLVVELPLHERDGSVDVGREDDRVAVCERLNHLGLRQFVVTVDEVLTGGRGGVDRDHCCPSLWVWWRKEIYKSMLAYKAPFTRFKKN